MNGQAIKAALGKNIKSLRSSRQFTQAVLAGKAEISIIFLSSIERGAKYPKPEILARIAKALEVEVFELFKGDLAPYDSKDLLNRLSGDITEKINLSIVEVFQRYLGNR